MIRQKDHFSEAVCIWHDLDMDKEFSIAGFKGIDIDFVNHIKNTPGMILALGPNPPPFQYLFNLQKLVSSKISDEVIEILDKKYSIFDIQPFLLEEKIDPVAFIKTRLDIDDCLIIQGPPGTGKTHFIAELIAQFASENKSILATALTNQALMEIVEKPALQNLLMEQKVYKTKISIDESKQQKRLMLAKNITPASGNVILSTFYITSDLALKKDERFSFDIVIMDESSQALLAMFAASKILGKKNIWIGDTHQLSPIVTISEDEIRNKRYNIFVNGLHSLSCSQLYPVFQFTHSYRLPPRGTDYTGIFYQNTLKSRSESGQRLLFNELSLNTRKLLHPMGGPVLIKMNLPKGNYQPEKGIAFTVNFIKELLGIKEKIHISVLSFFIKTIKSLQNKSFQEFGYHKNLIIETVSKIQGLTTDICIYFVPNTNYIRSLEKRLFNVATSRAKRHTIIIADKGILNERYVDKKVALFLKKLDMEFSFNADDF
ncbi:MAG: AAA family ATPase [Desulfamplus sp.]|nr:AAA family ATPase [Desulfamplus sp.]